MIVRTWTGVASTERVTDYVEYVRATGVDQYVRTPGCRQAFVLTRDLGGGASEVVALSVWEDIESLRAFTGPDVDAMVLYDEDDAYLLGEPTLTNHVAEVVLDGPGRPGVATAGSGAAGTRDLAAAFSGHRFREVYPVLAPDVRWTSVGSATITGRQAVIDACEATLAALAGGTTEFPRFVVIGDGDSVAVDAVGRYGDGAGGTRVVSSCDLYTFAGGALTSLTSYAVELDPATSSPA